MSSATLKLVHLGCVVLSYALFFLRGIWSLNSSPLLQRNIATVLPHVIDTVLLGSAIALAFMLGVSPAATPWLQTKLAALLLYIVLGSIAIKRGRTRTAKLSAWIAAQLVFWFIVATALTHNPMLWHPGD